MADLNITKLFKFPETLSQLQSLLSVFEKSLRTGQVEPVRHFLEVRLQDKKDRQHLISVIRNLNKILSKGLGMKETDPKREIMASMPPGYIVSKDKGKDVLRRVVEPVKAFTDRKKTVLKTLNVPSRTRLTFVNPRLSLEAESTVATATDLEYDFQRIDRLIGHALEEIAQSESSLPSLYEYIGEPELTGLAKRANEEDGLLEWSLFLVNCRSLKVNATHDDKSNCNTVSIESAVALPILMKWLMKKLPKALELLSKSKYAHEFPKLLKALRALNSVSEVILSD
jgi:hypothetical protein